MTEPPDEADGEQRLPTYALGGPASAAWREEALTRAMELQGLTAWIALAPGTGAHEVRLLTRIAAQLERARMEAAGEPDRDLTGQPMSWRKRLSRRWRDVKRAFRGASVERTLGSLDAVEIDLFRFAPDDYVCSLMPSLRAHVNRYLPKDDPRRIRLEPLAKRAETRPLSPAERGAALAAYHAANSQRRRELLRLRTFRMVLYGAATTLLFVAVGLGVLGSVRPALLPVCFVPDNEKVVCPTEETPLGRAAAGDESAGETSAGTEDVDVDAVMATTVSAWDLWLVELIGLVAAAVASAFALRDMKGTSTPYNPSVALALLKLSTGALTAFLGLMLMRGGFVPGLSALDNSAQILAWAIVFGYAQQLFTRLVDQQAQNVLEGVGGRGAGGDRPLATRPA